VPGKLGESVPHNWFAFKERASSPGKAFAAEFLHWTNNFMD